jgi:phosphoenolpyruvate carboxykinase (diphosphate)
MNKLFDEPLAVFNEKMLKPELQDMEAFVDGIKNIVEAQQKVAFVILRTEVWKLPYLP